MSGAELWNQIIEQVVVPTLPLVATAVGTVLTILFGFGISYLRKYIGKISNEKLADEFNFAVDTLDKIIEHTVAALNQEVVEDLKKAAVDGKLTEEEKKQIKDLAVSRVKQIIAPEVKNCLDKYISDLDSYISTAIERWVNVNNHFNKQ